MIIKSLYIILVFLTSNSFAQDAAEDTFLPDMGVVIQPANKFGRAGRSIDGTHVVKSRGMIDKKESYSVFVAEAFDTNSSTDKVTSQVTNFGKDYESKIEQLQAENSNLRNQIISLKQKLDLEILDVNLIEVESVKPEIEVSLPLEIFPFDNGTNEIANYVSTKTLEKKLTSVAGGGDTISALNNSGVTNNLTFFSTAGGAFLELLEGKELPGIKSIKLKKVKG